MRGGLDAPGQRSNPVRVLIFGINYAPEMTGVGPYTTMVAEHYAAMGHCVRVVTGVPHYPSWHAQAVPHRSGPVKVRTYRHFVPKRPNALGRALYELTWLVSAMRALRSDRADVVIGVVPSLSGAALAWLAGFRWRAPFGLVFQDLMGLSAEQTGYHGGGLVATVVRAAERFLARRATTVAIISDGFRAYLEQAGVDPSRILRVRNWARFEPSAELPSKTRRDLGWRPDEFICLHSGNMGKKQGLDNLIDAARLLEGSGIRIILAGDGNDRTRLIERAAGVHSSSLSFAPLQENGRVAAVLTAADVLIVSQRQAVADASLPSKLGAYFASGRPVVAAAAEDSATAREIAQSRAGIVVRPGDPDALAQALRALRDQPDRAEELGENGVAYAAANLTSDQAFKGFDRVLCSLLDMGRP